MARAGTSWECPLDGWVKINTDGVVGGRLNLATIGGVLRNNVVALDGSSLVSAIVELLLRNWIVRCCHVFRESNMVADKLASVRCSYSLVATEWSTPPPLVDLVHKEMSNS
ncbi:hypothetical protein V6N11_025220 [Hibiscus sabdariffa]|uniref:RNase H type-1 domain-containing protein n=1 Tax=Hibiscus sabdariffa TaxID=183260 RepID=A0ABR2QPG8_9ROSI